MVSPTYQTGAAFTESRPDVGSRIDDDPCRQATRPDRSNTPEPTGVGFEPSSGSLKSRGVPSSSAADVIERPSARPAGVPCKASECGTARAFVPSGPITESIDWPLMLAETAIWRPSLEIAGAPITFAPAPLHNWLVEPSANFQTLSRPPADET